ncbi:MAG: hypothetical protein ACRC30_05510 [Clostridium sp.]
MDVILGVKMKSLEKRNLRVCYRRLLLQCEYNVRLMGMNMKLKKL